MKRLLAMLACVACFGAPGQPLTGAERALIAGAISQADAERFGRHSDAAALRRIVALGDPYLVSHFGRGIQLANVDWSPEVESVVLQHFDDPRVGSYLRAMPGKYRTREMFERHYRRVAVAYELKEPSIRHILNTDLEGVEERLLKLSTKLPKGERGIDLYTSHVAWQRRHPAAIPVLLAALGDSFRGLDASRRNEVYDVLLAYPDVELWRRVAAEMDRHRDEGRITPAQHAAARPALDAMLADPAPKLAEIRRSLVHQRFASRVRQLPFNRGRLDELKSADPSAYLREQELFLLAQVKEAEALDFGLLQPEIATGYFHIGQFAHLRARDARTAARHYERAAALGHEMAQLALADTYQLALDDRAAAIAAYAKALAQARQSRPADTWSMYGASGSRVNAWWTAWLAQEIAFLETGRPFRGIIGEAEVGGFFEAMLERSAGAGVVLQDFRPRQSRRAWPGPANPADRPLTRTWASAQQDISFTVQRPTLKRRLDALPSSRIALMLTMTHASGLQDADDILAYFARNDPSGYWSACIFGTVAYLDTLGPTWPEEAVRNESSELLPGMADDTTPRPLSVAASRFMASRGLKVQPLARP